MVVRRLSVSLAERTTPEPVFLAGFVAAFRVVGAGGCSTVGAMPARASGDIVAANRDEALGHETPP